MSQWLWRREIVAKKVFLFTLITIAWMAIQSRLRPVACGPCMILDSTAYNSSAEAIDADDIDIAIATPQNCGACCWPDLFQLFSVPLVLGTSI